MITRILISTFLLSITLYSNSQDTIYFDKYQNYTDKISAFYFQVKHNDYSKPERFIVESFYTNGIRKEINYYADKLQLERTGVSEEWYSNGQLKSHRTFNHNKLNDTVITYWINGQLKREDIFRKGELIKGTCYDINGNKIPHFDYEQMPKYPGGDSEVFKDIYNTIEMPDVVKTELLKVKVIAKFSVDIEGFVSDIEIVLGSYPEVDKEVIRVLSSLKKWQPGLKDGEPVKVWYAVPITFQVR